LLNFLSLLVAVVVRAQVAVAVRAAIVLLYLVRVRAAGRPQNRLYRSVPVQATLSRLALEELAAHTLATVLEGRILTLAQLLQRAGALEAIARLVRQVVRAEEVDTNQPEAQEQLVRVSQAAAV
jgi:hypothetical protein